jgi:hypothetical protein
MGHLRDPKWRLNFGLAVAWNCVTPNGAVKSKGDSMAKKTLKKAKKIEATKPLLNVRQ